MLAAAWSALLLRQSLAASQRAATMEQRLRAHLTLTQEVMGLRHPPDIGLLCLASPLTGFRTRRTDEDGMMLELRWRHLGRAIILAELDVIDPTGGRLRLIGWLTPDSVAHGVGGLRCGGGRLRALTSPAVVARPGE